MSITGPDPSRSTGFTMISVLFILVGLASLAAALARLSQAQHLGSAMELDNARALQAARAGLEWATWTLMRSPEPPAAAPACFTATSFGLAATLSGFTVSLSCSRTPASGTLSDGETALVFYQVVATACNRPASGACPNSDTQEPTYVERQLAWTLTR